MNKIYQNKKELIRKLIKKTDIVLDIGFWGKGRVNNKNWTHDILLNEAKDVYGIDIDFDSSFLKNKNHYKKENAENFYFDFKFDVIFAGDLIEHLSNPGLFLSACARNLKDEGRLIITTPNCFNLFNISEKISKNEPTANKDHTFYFNKRTLARLLEKNNWEIIDIDFLYRLEDVNYKESLKKKFLNSIYYILSKFTSKYMETLIIVAGKHPHI